MDQLVSRLLLYGDLGEEAILSKLAALFQAWKGSSMPRQTLVRGIYHQVKGLLDLATEYGFDENLWQNYLTFLLMTNENSFSLITERVGAQDGSVNHFARNDFRVFRALFHYDFSAVEGDLNLDCFTTLSHYKAIAKHGRRYNQNVSEKVRDLSRRLAAAPDDETFFRLVTEHYRQYGVGMLGRIRPSASQPGAGGDWVYPHLQHGQGHAAGPGGLREPEGAAAAQHGGLPGGAKRQQRPALWGRRHRQVLQRQGSDQRVL